jgi:sec-independent protein translocase protein TatB
LLRKIGKFMGKMRGMANEFRASFDEMARQSELDELRKEVEAMRQASQNALPQNLGLEAALKSDAESAYMSSWAESHGPSTDLVPFDGGATPSILPPPAATPEVPAKTPKTATKTPAKNGQSSRSSAPRKAAASPKATDPSNAAPKPRARKAKPEAEA